jgi:hypothetical protein
MPAEASTRWIEGGCHCGAVRFCAAVDDEAAVTVQNCNCSMCAKTGFLHWIRPASRFRITRGQDQLSEYRFNTGTARHLFCRTCGVKSFYVPRSNPDGWSVNWRCLDDGHGIVPTFEDFDGQNWEAHGAALRALSAEPSALRDDHRL